MEDQLPEEKKVQTLREQDAKHVRIIEALDAIIKSPEWRTLKEEVFDDLLHTLQRREQLETNKPEISLPELYRIQGEKKWARRFSKLELLRDKYFKELVNIRKITPGG